MSILLKVKSENQSLAKRFDKYLIKILESSGYDICNNVPDFGIELILQEMPSFRFFGKTNLTALSVNYYI